MATPATELAEIVVERFKEKGLLEQLTLKVSGQRIASGTWTAEMKKA